MIMTTLREFFETGQVGPIALGATKDQVRDWLGIPTDTTFSTPKRGPNKHAYVAWQYGCLELGFSYDHVTYFGFEFHGARLPEGLDLEGYFPSQTTKRAEFEVYLRKENITYEEYEPLSFVAGQAIIVGVGVTVVFGSDNMELDSIQYIQQVRDKRAENASKATRRTMD
jgi:hypothetical protein